MLITRNTKTVLTYPFKIFALKTILSHNTQHMQIKYIQLPLLPASIKFTKRMYDHHQHQ